MKDGIIELGTERGKVLGFTAERFAESSYLWKVDRYILISFIESKGRGNFRALVNCILESGYGVKVPTPLGRMQEIVQKNGYTHTVEADANMGEVDVWVLESKRENDLIQGFIQDVAAAFGNTAEEVQALMDEVMVDMFNDKSCVCNQEVHRDSCPASANFPIHLFEKDDGE